MTRMNETDVDWRERADRVIDALYARQPENRVERRLDATAYALDLLGNPQRAYGIIHVTGTNGKSSTARIAASILRAHGLRTGVYTSPHLVRLNERIDVDGPIDDETLVRSWEDIEPYVQMTDAHLAEQGRAPLTYFETVTVLAFAVFADAPCDVVVLEVGMGGEWDATNVADADVAVFAPVALDHMQYLGSTIGEIARTKAGIIKADSLVVSGRQTPEALVEIEAAAAKHGASVSLLGRDFDVVADTPGVGGQQIDVRGLASTYRELLLPLLGAHQADNAAVAIAAVESFLGGGHQPIAREVLEEGIRRAVSPGRLQLVARDPAIVIDAAHNPHSAHALAIAFPTAFGFSETIGVVGVLADKDVDGVLAQLATILDHVILTASASPRALSVDDLAKRAEEYFPSERIETGDTVAQSLERAREIASEIDGAGVLVTGSITVIGEAVEALRAPDE